MLEVNEKGVPIDKNMGLRAKFVHVSVVNFAHYYEES